jgi:ribosomal protein L29
MTNDEIRKEAQISRLEEKLKDFKKRLLNLSYADKTLKVFDEIEIYKTEIAELETWIEELNNPMTDETTPCDVCQTPIATDIHAEELGMCIECSNAYFSQE